MEDIYIMNSKAKFKKNLTRIVCLVLAGVMLLGSFAYFTMGEIPTPVYSEGLTEEGFFEGVESGNWWTLDTSFLTQN